MITIPEVVEEIVKHSPFLEQALAEKILNLSALARIIKPEIEQKLFKEVEVGAIVMALKRQEVLLTKKQRKFKNQDIKIGDITVRSNIIEYTFENSETVIECQKKLLHLVDTSPNSFITVSQGVYETTIFISSNLSLEVNKLFKAEKLRKRFENLCSITLILPEESVYIPGVYYNILKILAWEGINFVEVISSFTELTIFLEKDNVDRAFSALKKLS